MLIAASLAAFLFLHAPAPVRTAPEHPAAAAPGEGVPVWSAAAGRPGATGDPLRGCASCLPGDLIESEPVCADEYVDRFNGGCNSSPHIFGEIACGQTVCGTYGTYLLGGTGRRDTDWYRFVLTEPSDVTWTAVGEAGTSVLILEETCPGSVLASATADACEPATATVSGLAAGTYYAFVGTDGSTGFSCGLRYRATLTAGACCPGVSPRPRDRTEGESLCAAEYIDEFNAGCNNVPFVFSPIGCGESVTGTYGTYTIGGADFRDTDWYRFFVSETSDVTWTVVGEAGTTALILEGPCSADVLGSGTATACDAATVTITGLAPGAYYLFVATTDFTGVPCGARYRATLAATACCAGVVARPGDLVEGEVVCFEDYVDNFNGGCDSTPDAFSEIACGQSVVGTFGTFDSGTQNLRDTDWYRFVLTETSNVAWTVTAEVGYLSYLFDGTCPASNILATADSTACVPDTAVATGLAPGTYYIFVGTNGVGGDTCGRRYRATLNTSACCQGVVRQPGDVDEGEPVCADGTVDSFNGGCAFTPHAFSPIACGQTVAGTYGTYSTGGVDRRDADWYRFVLTEPSDVTWTAVGEARTRVLIVDDRCPASPLGNVVADACQPATVTAEGLAAGTYHVLVRTDALTGDPCGLRYRATLTTDDCDCPADWSGDGAVNSSDISAFLTSWLAGVQGGPLDADFNGDLAVNSTDISAFLTAWLAAVQTGC